MEEKITEQLQKATIFLYLLILAVNGVPLKQRPNIIFILADDLGWNDVGFHGSSEIPTPNIDALAYSGLILNNYYVPYLCSPSRASLMTGKYPIRLGMQHEVLYAAEPRGLPLQERILPQHLRSLGYRTHIVGKWHLGFYKKEYTPTERGFETHLGYWTGHQDYFDHTLMEGFFHGHDMRRGMDVAWDLVGKYSTDVYTNEAIKLINNHNVSSPLFLYLAHAATHVGNLYSPLQAPQNIIDSLNYIKDEKRRKFAAMMVKLDESVGNVVEALSNRGMLKNSIIIFTTDNGGARGNFNPNVASNWPLRGGKETLWEGGVRGTGLIWSPLISLPHRVATQMMHISDWLPTLLSVAGGDTSLLDKIDGYDLWQALSNNEKSQRRSILHNIDWISETAALMFDSWKIMKGNTKFGIWNDWSVPFESDYKYNITEVLVSKAGLAVDALNLGFSDTSALRLRQDANVQCTSSELNSKADKCNPAIKYCLFDISTDPCERINLANKYPEIVQNLEFVLKEYNASVAQPSNKPMDLRADPVYWNNTWTNFGDYLHLP